jgi:hypothetical protein
MPRTWAQTIDFLRKARPLELVKHAAPILQEVGIQDPPISWAGNHDRMAALIIGELFGMEGRQEGLLCAWVVPALRELQRVSPFMQDPGDLVSALVKLATIRAFFLVIAATNPPAPLPN